MAKYSDKLVKEIISYVEDDSFTVSEICQYLKISRKSFYEWKATKPEFAKALEDAYEHCEEKLVIMARRSLKNKIMGYAIMETKTTSVPDRNDPTGYRVIKKVTRRIDREADTATIKLVLERNDKRQAEKKAKEQEKEKPEYRPLNITVVDQEAKHNLQFLRDTMRDGTHPQITGIRRPDNWEDKYIEADRLEAEEKPKKENTTPPTTISKEEPESKAE